MLGTKYRLLRKIASGGMAEVHLAVQQGLAGFEKLVVIKKIHPHLCEDHRFVQMFLNEACLAASLTHPNIVQIFDVHRDGDTFFIAMEYLSGETLRFVISTYRNHKLLIPVPLACRIVADAAAGLHAAHEAKDHTGNPKGIVHRDVSPSNVIVSYDGVTKLLDFGVAKANVYNIYSRPGTLKGKFAYISPEAIEHRDIDRRSDIFSLGTVLWEMLTAQRLFKGPTEARVLRSVMEDTILRPSQVNPAVPPWLDDLVGRMLERDVAKRLPSAGLVRRELDKGLGALHEPITAHNVAEWMQTTFRTRYEERKEIEKNSALPDVPTAEAVVLGGHTPSSDVEPDRATPTSPSPPKGELLAAKRPWRRRQAILLWSGLFGLAVVVTATTTYLLTRGPSSGSAPLSAPAKTATTAEIKPGVGSTRAAPVTTQLDPPSIKPQPQAGLHPESPTVEPEPARRRAAAKKKFVKTARRPLRKTTAVAAVVPAAPPVEEPAPAPKKAARPDTPTPAKAKPAALPPAKPAPKTTAPAAPAQPIPTTGRLKILSDSPGFIFVDGNNTGRSTPAELELSVGAHEIIVVLKDTSSRITHRVNVKPGKTLKLQLR